MSIAQKTEIAVPQTLAEADALLKQLASSQREIERIQADLNAEIAERAKKAGEKAAPYVADRNGLALALAEFARLHRKELTEGKTKTVKLTLGRLFWRLQAKRATIPAALQASVIAAFKKLGLDRFIEVKEKIKFSAVNKELDTVVGVQGVAIVGGSEQFYIGLDEIPVELGVAAGAVRVEDKRKKKSRPR